MLSCGGFCSHSRILVYWLFPLVLYSIIFMLLVPIKNNILFSYGKKGNLSLISNTRKVKAVFLFIVFYNSFSHQRWFSLDLGIVSLLSAKSGTCFSNQTGNSTFSTTNDVKFMGVIFFLFPSYSVAIAAHRKICRNHVCLVALWLV